MFLGLIAISFGGVLNDRFDPCLLTVFGCKSSSTTKAPITKAPENQQLKAKLVSFKNLKIQFCFNILVHFQAELEKMDTELMKKNIMLKSEIVSKYLSMPKV